MNMRTLALAAMALAAAGCVPHGSPLENMKPDHAAQMRTLAGTTATEIMAAYPGRMVFVDEEHMQGSFADRLRQELAGRRMLSLSRSPSDLVVRYSLEEFDDTMGYINLRFSDGRVMSRTFPLKVAPQTMAPKPAQPRQAPPAPPAPAPRVTPLRDAPAASPAARALEEIKAPAPKDGFITYAIRHGDNVGAIARAHGCTKQDIYRANGGIDHVLPLELGRKIRIPVAQAPQAAHVPAPAAAKSTVPAPVKAEMAFKAPAKPEAVHPAPAPAPARASQQPPAKPAAWMVRAGSLRVQLSGWCSRAGWQLAWDTDTDLDMRTSAAFPGSFTEAVTQLFSGLHDSGQPLTATLYSRNRVLRIGDR